VSLSEADGRKRFAIAHVFAVHSLDGIYGGPARVAIEQARSLIDAGHSVTIFAGWTGSDPPPTTIEGVPCELRKTRQIARSLGFAGTVAPGLLSSLHKRINEFDIVHVHLARDLISLPIAARVLGTGTPLVLQTHGMIDQSTSVLARLLDAILTRRVLHGARSILALSDRETEDLVIVGAHFSSIDVVGNGVRPAPPKGKNPSSKRDVLFLARMHERKRPLLFVEAAVQIARAWPDVTFTLIGPDEGEGPKVSSLIRSAGLGDQIRWIGPIHPEDVTERMRDSDLYVLPATDEPFGLTLVEAMSVGLPVIVGDGSVLASPIRDAGAGATYDGTAQSLAAAISRLLGEPEEMRSAGLRGIHYVQENWSIEAITRRVEMIYNRAVGEISSSTKPSRRTERKL
jgi:glycosyltransferase involved in cell wall biosynthesis